MRFSACMLRTVRGAKRVAFDFAESGHNNKDLGADGERFQAEGERSEAEAAAPAAAFGG